MSFRSVSWLGVACVWASGCAEEPAGSEQMPLGAMPTESTVAGPAASPTTAVPSSVATPSVAPTAGPSTPLTPAATSSVPDATATGAGGQPNGAGGSGPAGTSDAPGGSGGVSAGPGPGGGSPVLAAGGAAGTGGGGGEHADGAGGAGGAAGSVDLLELAAGFDELYMHDACTAPNPSQPDTCIHVQELEESFSFGGEPDTTYDVTLRIRGLFEPTTVMGGEVPDPEHPYFKAGGSVTAPDYSQWHIEVAAPEQTYWLNHYPEVSHTIYQQDFEVTIAIAGGSDVAVRVVDGNDRQIDNGATGLDDRQQTIEGVTEGVLDGQVLRIDVVDVALR